MNNFYLILVYLLIGILLRRIRSIPDNASLALNSFVLYVSMPAVILQKVPSISFSGQLLIPLLTPWILLILVALLIITLAKLLGWSKQVTGALLIVLPLGNTSFLGFPMVESFYGHTAMPYIVIYDQLGTFIALATYATIIATLYGNSGNPLSWSKILLKILSFPAFLALLIGLAFRQHEYPAFIQQLIDNLSLTLIPVVMVAVGFSLKLRLDNHHRAPFLIGLGTKLLLMPLFTFILWQGMGQDNLAATVSIFAAAMPPMISAGAVAIIAGLVPELVSALVGIGLLLSLITLPVLHWLLTLA
ncbi:AEC family transporter [Neptunicella sp. SCSIO 80796]|uniref:AEC family transporter n=1 Tax=Neptunicella plasticusilytica TaxID=3117012 RepID=UPI003A4D80D1